MQATPGKTLMIVDQLAMYREGLRRLLYESGFHAIWCHDDLPDDLPTALSQHPPELLLIGTDVATARRQIAEVKRYYPSCRIVLLLDTDPPDEMEAALECGADSIIRRESSCDALYGTLRLVFEDVTVMPSRVLDVLRAARRARKAEQLAAPGHGMQLIASEAEAPPAAQSGTMAITAATMPSAIHAPPAQNCALSTRELSVLQGLMEGLPNKQIARQLDITEATVKVHVKSILRKTGVRNRTQVAMWASHQLPDSSTDRSHNLGGPPVAPASIEPPHVSRPCDA